MMCCLRRAIPAKFSVHLAAACVLVASIPCAVARAQTNGPIFRIESSLVLVPTLVTDREGHVVFGLHENDFVLYDNGVEQKVTLDEPIASRPVSLVVAVLRGGRAAEVLGAGCPAPRQSDLFTRKPGKCGTPLHGIAQMLETFVQEPGSDMALVSFDSHVTIRANFTSDTEAIARQLEQLPVGDSGSAILDAVQQSLDLLRTRSPAQRHVMVIVSEKSDRGSTRSSLQEAAQRIAATNTEVYMVAIDDPDAGKEGIKMMARLLGPMVLAAIGAPPGGMMPPGGAHSTAGTTSPQTSFPASQTEAQPFVPGRIHTTIDIAHHGDQSDIPQSLANLTGGEYILFSDKRGLDEALGQLANHAHNRYQLSYRPSGAPGLHRIRVTMREPMGVNIAARSTYWQSTRSVDSGVQPD